MLTPVLADMFMKTTTSSSQVAETGKATVDSAFQKIFDSSMQNSAKTSQDSNEAIATGRSETANEADTSKTNSQTDTSKANSEAETSRTDTETENAASAKSDEKNADSGDSSDDTEKTDGETPAGKIEKLKKDDPQSYDSTIANIDNMNLGDLLSALGLNAADISGLKSGVDLTASVPEDLKLALQSGDWKGVGSALASLGIDSSGGSGSLSILASQATTATTGAAGESSANLKSDSSASVATANDSDATSAPQSSTTVVSTDNSSSLTASSDLDNGSTGLGADSKSSASSVVSGTVNASSSESKPAVNATDPLKQAESVSIASGAQVRTDGAAQQAESKPAVTTQNLTNETDKTSIVSGQTGKADQTQTPSTARAANSSRQTFERMVLDQVVDKARIIVRPNGASSMVIKLDPPSLGQIDMRIDVKDGSVRAAIVADSKEVKAAIEGNIENLKNSLHANGLKVDEISVTVAGDQGFKFRNDSMSQQTGAQGNGEGRRGAHGQAANGSMADAQNDSLASRAGTYRHSGLLDVVA